MGRGAKVVCDGVGCVGRMDQCSFCLARLDQTTALKVALAEEFKVYYRPFGKTKTFCLPRQNS